MRRSMRRPAAKQEGSWQMIYMDLMTTIMVFFVILWSLNQGKDQGISETVGDVTTRLINLPGDVLFPPGKVSLSDEGKSVMKSLFSSDNGAGLSFESSDLTKRMLVIHGHTDSDGRKEQNLELGYRRAYAAYQEINSYSKGLSDHVVICTHADNSPVADVPNVKSKKNLSADQIKALKEAKSKNRRITIEDKMVNTFEVDESK